VQHAVAVEREEPGVGAARIPVVALVSSAGGLAAMSAVLAPLPADLPAAIIALQHFSPIKQSHLPQLLRRHTALRVRAAVDGDVLAPGLVLVVPPAKHLLVGVDERVRLIDVGPQPGPRPSADLLLCTLAVAVGPRVLAVVLSGSGRDGSLGAQAVRAFGGRVLVQDEQSALYYGMPASALAADSPVPPLPLSGIAAAICQLDHRPESASVVGI
jgi:two-component system chemotaxis response regulator CheB